MKFIITEQQSDKFASSLETLLNTEFSNEELIARIEVKVNNNFSEPIYIITIVFYWKKGISSTYDSLKWKVDDFIKFNFNIRYSIYKDFINKI